MKNYWIILLVSFVSVSHVFAQDVPEQQRPLLSKVAATWCPPCGGWGWDMFENMIDENEEKATLLVAHHSGDLTNSVAQDFSDNFNAPYQPYFYYNNEDQDVTSSNATAKLTEIKNKVDAAWLESPVANAGIAMFIDGTDLNVSTKTKFFQEATGEYYLGVYFVESNIVNNQAGQGNDAVHEKILRGAISSGSFGELLDNGTISTGTEFEHNFVAPLNNMDTEHLEVVTIIWKKENDTYEAVNTNVSSDFTPVVSATTELKLSNAIMKITPNVVNSQAVISLLVNKPLAEAQLYIYDLNGIAVQPIFEGAIAAGTSTFTIEKTSAIPKGLYHIVLKSDKLVVSKPIVFL